MFVRKNFSLRGVMIFSGHHLGWMTAWAAIVAAYFTFTKHADFRIPWLPLSLIGTAVAFYVGFKNNSAYDRLWEARKIWGAIVNSSRMWATTAKAFVNNQSTSISVSAGELAIIHKDLLYRHIAWLYALRSQLLIPTPWEHINQNRLVKMTAKRRMKKFGVGLLNDGTTEEQLSRYLEKSEMETVIDFQNTATQIIDNQSQRLRELRSQDLIDDFRHMELQKILNDFYTHQGKCERIKKFPLPRQYGGMSFIFVGIFIFLLPFGLVSEFVSLAEGTSLEGYGAWLSIPFTVLVSWVYLVMELVGDYSENPFEGMGNDIPMLALCRTIEIDLKEMLGEKELPPKIQAVNGVLM